MLDYIAACHAALRVICILFAVYGTSVVHQVTPGCWTGAEAQSVVHIAQGMIYTTWALTALLV